MTRHSTAATVVIVAIAGAALGIRAFEASPGDARAAVGKSSGARLGVVVLDADGAPVSGRPTCAVVRPNERRVVHRFEGPTAELSEPPQPSDELYVYCRGYDLACVPLGASTDHEVRVRRCSSEAHLVLSGDGVASVSTGIRCLVNLTVPGNWALEQGETYPRGPLRDTYEIIIDARADHIALPQGMRCDALLQGDDVLVWPLNVHLHPGDIDVHLEVLREIQLKGTDEDAESLELFPDLTWAPDGPPERTDAIDQWVFSTHWWRVKYGAASKSLTRVPAARFHAVWTSDGTAKYAVLQPEATDFDLGKETPRRPLGRGVSVDGHPAEAGSCVLPGRLDAVTVGLLRTKPNNRLRLYSDVGAGGAMSMSDIPGSDEVTIVAPDGGISYGRGPYDRQLEAASCATRVEVELVGPGGASGTVALWPGWIGTPAHFTRSSVGNLLRKFENTNMVVLTGIPFGVYRLQVFGTAPGASEVVDRSSCHLLTLTVDRPAARIRIETK